MLLEGQQLLLTIRNLKVANYTSTKRLKKRLLYPFGYGIPAMIVAVSAGLKPLDMAHLHSEWGAELLLMGKCVYTSLHGKSRDNNRKLFKTIIIIIINIDIHNINSSGASSSHLPFPMSRLPAKHFVYNIPFDTQYPPLKQGLFLCPHLTGEETETQGSCD